MTSRRTVLKSGLTTLGGLCLATAVPRALLAQQDADGGPGDDDTWEIDTGGSVVVHPVEHASLVLETPGGVLYVDPVGGAERYADLPPPGVVFVTHEHGDHYDAETLGALLGEGVTLFTNPAVYGMLPEALRERAVALANGDETTTETLRIEAVPAYNITDDRLDFHPQGRDNGYVVTIGDAMRVYLAGDTEATEEMRRMPDIDVAFVPMNLPYTMDVEQAASGVLEFRPRVVYPYHYRGQEGVSDVEAFARLVNEENDDIVVALRDWYA